MAGSHLQPGRTEENRLRSGSRSALPIRLPDPEQPEAEEASGPDDERPANLPIKLHYGVGSVARHVRLLALAVKADARGDTAEPRYPVCCDVDRPAPDHALDGIRNDILDALAILVLGKPVAEDRRHAGPAL